MKKTAIALILFVASAAAFAASVDEQIPHSRSYEIKIRDNGRWFSEMRITAFENQATPLSSTTEQSYSASCDMTDTGPSINPGKLATGTMLVVKPDGANADAVNFRWNIVDLVEMQKVKKGACEIELPRTQTHAGATDVLLPAGKSVSMVSGPYTLVLTRTN